MLAPPVCAWSAFRANLASFLKRQTASRVVLIALDHLLIPKITVGPFTAKVGGPIYRIMAWQARIEIWAAEDFDGRAFSHG
jgi:hypothetical protein